MSVLAVSLVLPADNISRTEKYCCNTEKKERKQSRSIIYPPQSIKVLHKHCCCLCCSAVLVSQRGNAEGVQEATGDPPREVVKRRKAVATARPRDRRDIEASISRRQAEIAARDNLSPEGKKVEAIKK